MGRLRASAVTLDEPMMNCGRRRTHATVVVLSQNRVTDRSTNRSSKTLRPNWTARSSLRLMERVFWWGDERPLVWCSSMRVCNSHPKRLIRSWLLGLEKRRILLHAAGPLESTREENSSQRGNRETWNWSSRKSHWSWRQGWSSLIRNIPSGTRKLRDDKWPRIRCQRDAGGDVVDRKSSSSRRRLLTRLEEVEP